MPELQDQQGPQPLHSLIPHLTLAPVSRGGLFLLRGDLLRVGLLRAPAPFGDWRAYDRLFASRSGCLVQWCLYLRHD
jgi:hypothetical protein